MRRPRAVLFDLDGTLVDSVADIAAALNQALAAFAVPGLDVATVRTLVGHGARRLVERALKTHPEAAAEPAAVLEAFLEAYGARPAEQSRVYPGARDALVSLRADGLKLGVATNKPAYLTRAILDALDLSPLLDAAVGSVPGLSLKPAPDLIRKVSAELGVTPENALMVGDSRTDVDAARAAGCPVIVMAHGYSTEPPELLGADAVMADFGGVTAYVRSLPAEPVARSTGTP